MVAMAEKKKPARQPRSGKPIQIWIPADLHGELTEFVASQRFRTTMTDVVELAIRELLERERVGDRSARRSSRRRTARTAALPQPIPTCRGARSDAARG